MIDVSVVIVSFNTKDLLEHCLRSIQTQTAASVRHEVIVVDNASSDGSVEMVESTFPDVKVIMSAENLGFARACNLGVASAEGRHICLLNPDAEVIGNTIGILLQFAREHPAAGIYGGRSVHRDGSLDPKSCWALPSLWSLFCFASGLSKLFANTRAFDPESMGGWKRNTVRQVDVVTGYLLMTRMNVWRELGGFDERFFLYGDDIDLAHRARAVGYRPLITPLAVVRHVGGAATTKTIKLMFLMTGKATYIRKHYNGLAKRFALVCLLAGAGLRAKLVRGKASVWPEVFARRQEWISGYPVITINLRTSDAVTHSQKR